MKKVSIVPLKNYQKDYKKNAQRAEILLRNKLFSSELVDLKYQLGNEFFLRQSEILGAESEDHRYLDNHTEPIVPLMQVWDLFCFRWRINNRWDGKPNTLKEFQKSRVRLMYQPDKRIMQKGYLSLHIDAWTTLDDIKTIWHEVEKNQKYWFDHKEFKKSNFGRDIWWYDLRHEQRLTYREIASLWMKKHPKDFNTMIVNRLKKDTSFISKMREFIQNNNSLRNQEKEILNDNTRLAYELTKGKLAKDFGYALHDEITFYTTGEHYGRKSTPPCVGMIAAAIRRIRQCVESESGSEKIPDSCKLNQEYGVWLAESDTDSNIITSS